MSNWTCIKDGSPQVEYEPYLVEMTDGSVGMITYIDGEWCTDTSQCELHGYGEGVERIPDQNIIVAWRPMEGLYRES